MLISRTNFNVKNQYNKTNYESLNNFKYICIYCIQYYYRITISYLQLSTFFLIILIPKKYQL